MSCEELNELRVLAANGADSAELAQETADLIALLHQARSSNLTVSAKPHLCFLPNRRIFPQLQTHSVSGKLALNHCVDSNVRHIFVCLCLLLLPTRC